MTTMTIQEAQEEARLEREILAVLLKLRDDPMLKTRIGLQIDRISELDRYIMTKIIEDSGENFEELTIADPIALNNQAHPRRASDER